MPLARIFGSPTDELLSLAEQLGACGFEVQTVAVGDDCSQPADLEINLEECIAEEAFSKITAAVDDEKACVIIAPGTIVNVPVEGHAPVLAPVRNVDPMFADEPAAPELVTAMQELPECDLPKLTDAPPLEALDEAAFQRTLEAAYVIQQQDEFQYPAVEAAQVFQNQVETAEFGRFARDESEPSRMPASEIEPLEVEVLEPASRHASGRPIWPLHIEHATAQSQHAVRVRRQDLILAQIQTVRNKTAGYFSAICSRVRIPTRVRVRIRLRIPARLRIISQFSFAPFLSNDRLFWRAASLAAATSVFLIVAGLSAHRFAPLPPKLLQGSSEALKPAPFHKARVAPIPTAGTRVIVADTLTPVTSPSLILPLEASPKPLSSTQTAMHSHRHESSKSAFASDEADVIAKDTVVRYNRQPRTPPTHALNQPRALNQQGGVKYYSDLKSN